MSQTSTKAKHTISCHTGDAAYTSGLYRSKHPGCRGSREIWVKSGELFPLCPRCGQAGQFHLQQPVAHISEDSDFQ